MHCYIMDDMLRCLCHAARDAGDAISMLCRYVDVYAAVLCRLQTRFDTLLADALIPPAEHRHATCLLLVTLAAVCALILFYYARYDMMLLIFRRYAVCLPSRPCYAIALRCRRCYAILLRPPFTTPATVTTAVTAFVTSYRCHHVTPFLHGALHTTPRRDATPH